MGAIAINVNEINNNILPKLNNVASDLQTAYSTSLNLKNNLPVYNSKGYAGEIVNDIYNLTKEIRNVTLNISDKSDKISQIEKKSNSMISSIASQINNIGLVTGAVSGSVKGVLSSSEVKNDSQNKTNSEMSETGAKVSSKVESKTKGFWASIGDQIKNVGSKISSGVKSAVNWVSDKAHTAYEWVSDKFTKAKDWTCQAIKDTGAWISNAASTVWSGIKSAWNWITDGENWKRLGASFVNGVLSLVKGVVSLVEAIGDLVILIGGAVGTIGTALYDVGKGIVTGDWSFSTTSDWWKDCIVPVVAYDWTSALDKKLGWRQYFDQWAYEPFKSDGMGCQILEGVGYVAGVIALTVATFGAGGVAVGAASGVSATTMALTAGAAGIGKGTQEAWAHSIEQNMKQEVVKEIQNIQITEEMYTNKLSELMAQENREYTGEEVVNAICNDLYAQRMNEINGWQTDFSKVQTGAKTLEGKEVASGLAYGVGSGVVDGLQWYAGGKINTLFKSAGTTVSNKLLASALRVGLDVTDGVAEIPVRTALQTLYREDEYGNKMNFSDVFEANGGWNQVATTAITAALASGFGESIDALTGAIASGKIISALENMDENTDAVLSKQLSKLSDVDVKKIADQIFDEDDIVKSLVLLSNLNESKFDAIIKNIDMIESDSDTSKFVKKVVDIYTDGQAAAQGKYNNFFKNFREHGIGHSSEVASYAEQIAKMIDNVDVDETVYAAFVHDFGMRGGYTYVDEELATAIEKASGTACQYRGKWIPIDSLEGLKFEKADFLDNLARKNHPLNSALAVLTDQSILPSNVDDDVVALLAMTHSKSTSGIKHFSSESEWIKAIDKLDSTLKQYNIDNGTSYVFDANRLKSMISDPEQFLRLQDEALAIRDGDAMSSIVRRNGGTLMQDGTISFARTREVRENYNTPVLSKKEELKLVEDAIYDEKGNFIRFLTDDESFSKKIHIGESNVEFSSSYVNGNYTATVEIVNPNMAPNATFDAIEERIGEVNTYTNADSRVFEIVLPKDAQGTELGKWYEKTLQSLKSDSSKKHLIFDSDVELFEGKISDKIWQKQQEFYNNLRIVYR